MKNKYLVIMLALAFILGFLTFGEVSPSWADRDAIKVGMSLSMSGKYDVFGKRELWGSKLWAQWVNEKGGIHVKELGKKLPIELVWYDDKSDKGVTVKMIERLIVEDKVDYILGPYGSGLNMAAASVTERYGKLMIIHAGASDKIYHRGWKYVVGVLTPSTRYYMSAMEMMSKLKPEIRRIAIIVEDNPFNLSIRDGIRMWAKVLGFEEVFHEVYPLHPTDLSPILTKVKGADQDAILAASHFRDGALLAKQIAEYKVYTKLIGFGSAPSTTEWWKTLGGVANYHISASQWEPVDAPDPAKFSNWYGPKMTGREFNDWFKKTWGEGTDFRGTQIFQAGLALQWGIEKGGSLDTDKIRKALNDVDFMSFYGRCKIDPETGIQIGHEMVVPQWQDGKLVVVWPLSLAEGKLIYPIPFWEKR